MNFTRKLERELTTNPPATPEDWVAAGAVLSDDDFLVQMDELKGGDGFQKFIGLVAFPEDVLEGDFLPEAISEEIKDMALDVARMIARYRALQKVGV